MMILSIDYASGSLNPITVALRKYPERYTVEVVDTEGLLHLVEFRHFGPVDMLRAAGEARDWFDTVSETVSEYVSNPNAMSTREFLDLASYN